MKLIILYSNGCSGGSEVISDLENSFETNKSFFEKNLIDIKFDTVQNKCGYLFKWNKKEKEIPSVMTDIDLQKFANQFFEVKK